MIFSSRSTAGEPIGCPLPVHGIHRGDDVCPEDLELLPEVLRRRDHARHELVHGQLHKETIARLAVRPGHDGQHQRAPH